MRDFLDWVCISIFTHYMLLLVYIHVGRSLNVRFNPIAVNHLDYLGVQVAWVTGPWFLTIFMNMLPWESGQVLYVSLDINTNCSSRGSF